MKLDAYIYHLCFVWLSEENEKKERGEKEYEKREKSEKYNRFEVLFCIREIEEKEVCCLFPLYLVG